MSFPPPPADAPASAHRGHHSRGDRDRGHYQAADSRRRFSADAGDAPRGDGQFHARPDGDIMRPPPSSRRDFPRDDRRDFSRDDRRSEYRRGGGDFDMGTSGLPPSRQPAHGAVPGLARNQHPEQPPPLPMIRIGGVLPGSIPPPPPLPPVQAPTYATTPTAPAALEGYRPQHDHRQHRSGDGDAAAGADRRQERHARDREERRSGRDERGDRDRDGSRRKRSSRKTRSYSSSVSASSRSASSSRSSLSSDDSYARRREKRHRRDAKDKSRREKRDKYRSERKHRSSRYRHSISSDSSYTSDSDASSITSSGSSYSSASDRRRSRRHRSSGKSSSRRTRESRTERKSHDRTSRRDRPDAATVDGAAAPQHQQPHHQQPPRSVPHRALGDADVRREEQQVLRLDGAAPAMPAPTTTAVAASGAAAQQLVVLSREDERREQRRREKEAERRQRELDKQRKRRQREADEARRKKEKAQRHKRRRAASFSGSDVSGDEDDDTAGDVSSSSMSESDASSSRSGGSDADYDLPPTGAGGSSEAFWAGFGHCAEDGAVTGAPSAASAAHANDDEAFIPREPTDQELAAHSKMLTARLRLQPGEELPNAAELADVDDGTSLTIALQITRLRRADAVGPHATATEPDTPLTPYLIYHMLRNDGFPRKIVMMVPKSIAAPRIDDDPEGGAGIIDKEYQGYHLHSLRCLVEVDGVDSKRRLLYRFGRAAMPNSPPGIVMRVSETTSFVVTAMPCPPGTKVYAHVNNPTTLVVTQACVHMLGPVWPRHFFRPRGATGIAETPHDGPFMQFKGPIRIALPSPGASSLPGTYTPRSAVLSPNDGMHGGSRMRRANEGMMQAAGGGGGHGTPRGLGPRIDPRDRPYPSPSMGPSLASVGSVGRSPHLHSDSRGGLSSYDAAPMDGHPTSRPPRRHDYASDFDARDSRRGEARGRGFDRPDRPPSQHHHTSHSHYRQDGPHPPPQQQQPPYGRFGGDDAPRHSERPHPRDPDPRDYPSERGLMIPTVRVGPRVDVGQGMPSSAASHTLSAHSGSLRGGDHFERPERYREGDADRFDRGGGGSHRSGAPVGHHLGDRRRERSPASYRGGGGAYPDRGHGDGGRDDMHRGRGELHGATGAREFHHGPRDGPMSSRPRRDGHDRRHHYESGNGHGDMAAAHRLPSWSQQQQQQQHSLRSPIDAQLAPGDAQYHQRPGTAQPREESTIRGEDIYSF